MYTYPRLHVLVGWRGEPPLTSAEQPASLPAMAGSCQAFHHTRGGAPSPLLPLEPAGAYNGRQPMRGTATRWGPL